MRSTTWHYPDSSLTPEWITYAGDHWMNLWWIKILKWRDTCEPSVYQLSLEREEIPFLLDISIDEIRSSLKTWGIPDRIQTAYQEARQGEKSHEQLF